MATGFNLSSAEVSKVLPKGKISCLGPTVDMRAGGHLSRADPVQYGGGGGSRKTTSFSEADWR